MKPNNANVPHKKQAATSYELKRQQAFGAAQAKRAAEAAKNRVGTPTPIRFAGQSPDVAQERVQRAERLYQKYMAQAYGSAGVDPKNFLPEKGFEYNKQNLQGIYNYYTNTYLKNPEQFKWAGMAAVAAKTTFYPGMMAVSAAKNDMITAMSIHGGPLDPFTENAKNVETTFVNGAKRIFDDMAWQHEAYQTSELAHLSFIGSVFPDRVSDDVLTAWKDIDSRDPQRVNNGSKGLLYQEQWNVVQKDYNTIKDLAMGDLVGIALSNGANSPVVGGKPFTEVVPGGVLTDANDRWQWIAKDMFPAWVNSEANGGGAKQVNVGYPERANDELVKLVQQAMQNFISVPGLDQVIDPSVIKIGN